MVHANLCTRTVWPQFQLQYWRGAPVRSRCCLQRVLGGQPAVVVLARGARMHWVLHYSCFKQIININSPLFAGRLGVKANEPTLKALVEQDYGVSFGPSRRHEHLHTRQGSCAGAVPESELHGFSAQHDMTLS
ncbi:hypothetical protein KEM52_001076 [Ascosphaera acerosa]|nr:hypothetical protein KEM52_001076 [Ascosphaera acerosa]